MFIVSVHDETGLSLSERTAYREDDINFTKHEFSVLFPNKKVKVTEYIPRTKESAEKEIKEKQKKLKK